MRKIWSLALGLLIGGAIGVLLVMIFAPATGTRLRRIIRESYAEALAEARVAGLKREAELQADLLRRQRPRPPRT
jgi:gas vesicle protein